MTAEINLCLSTREYPPTFSGSAIRFSRYAPGLLARGVRMSVFTGAPPEALPGGERPKHRVGEFLSPESIGGIPVQRVALPAGGICRKNTTYAPGLVRYCSSPHSRPDVIQAISISQCWLPWYPAIRRLHIPIVLTITMLSELSDKPIKRMLQKLYRRIPFFFADRVVVSTAMVAQYIQELNPGKKIDVIPNGVDLERFRPCPSAEQKETLRRKLGLDPKAELVLFVGSLIFRKGVDVLLEAWNIIARSRPNARLVLVGPDGADKTGGSQNSPVDLNAVPDEIKATVIHVGSYPEVEGYYQAADVFVFPSRREGFGNVVLEAYASRLPVILAPFVGLSEELGRPDTHYLLTEREPREVAEAISILLDDGRLRTRLQENAYAWTVRNFAIEQSVRAYSEIYAELAKAG
jgi:glycosyltransferase involved in cell wall biosynthesis